MEKSPHEPLLGGNYITYTSRWGMLFIFCMLSFTNAMMWITFAPISDNTSDYFNGNIFENHDKYAF
jgi:hypothetical protein